MRAQPLRSTDPEVQTQKYRPRSTDSEVPAKKYRLVNTRSAVQAPQYSLRSTGSEVQAALDHLGGEARLGAALLLVRVQHLLWQRRTLRSHGAAVAAATQREWRRGAQHGDKGAVNATAQSDASGMHNIAAVRDGASLSSDAIISRTAANQIWL
jgi:hypothetical protein